MLIAGRMPVLQALEEGKQLDRIYVDQKLRGGLIEEIRAKAAQQLVPVNSVPLAKIESFHVPDHDGCVALLSKIRYQQLQDAISWIHECGQVPLFLILDGITDVRNIGAIARTAYCCGVQAIIIPEKGVGALNEDAMLTSAGALEKIMICRVPSLMKAVDELHLNGISVFASAMKAEQTISETDFTHPCAIVMGSEEKGIYPALLKICDRQIRIPMITDFESLNVSVATGMILYEAMRQRLKQS